MPLEEGWQNPKLVAALKDGREIPFGCMIWSAGLEPVKFIKYLDKYSKRIEKGASGDGPDNRFKLEHC